MNKVISIWIVNFLIVLCLSQSQQDCENTTPSVIVDCSSKSTSRNSCCYYRSMGARLCKWQESKVVSTILDVDGTVYQCDNFRGVPCGPVIANNSTECSKNSFITNSCCYYKDNQKIGRCMWWGEGFQGDVEYQGYEIECFSVKLKSLFVIIVIVVTLTLA